MFEEVIPAEKQAKKVIEPILSVVAPSVVKTTPVSRLTDKERRSRYLHTENLSTPSISGMMGGNNMFGVSEPVAQALSANNEILGRTFDLSQLLCAWKDFAESVDAAQLKSALSVREPTLDEEANVIYYLDNEVQRQRIVLDLKPKLLAHLHAALQNEKIKVEFIVTENNEEILNKPYTNQEKFNVLAAKYPVLGIMKQRLGLDFE